jgi:hypothetical protein
VARGRTLAGRAATERAPAAGLIISTDMTGSLPTDS